MSGRARRRGGAALLVAGAGALFLLFFQHRSSSTTASPAGETIVTSASAPGLAHSTPETAAAQPIETRPLDPNASTRFIDEVLVDRTEVCANETALVTVKAHDPRANPRPLLLNVSGNRGDRVPVSFAAPGQYPVLVSASSEDRQMEVRAFTLHVRDCGGAFQYVRVMHEATEKLDTQRFVATPFFDRLECHDLPRAEMLRCNARPPSGEAYTYVWDFGDGSRETTHDGYIEHNYSHRPQDDVLSSFLVKVEVESTSLGKLTGLTSLAFENLSNANKRRLGVITPTIRLDSREGGSDGSKVTWNANVLNPDQATLTLENVSVTVTPCGGGDIRILQRRARDVFDDVTLPPGTSARRVQFSDGDLDSFCSVLFEATGFAPGGYRVQAVFGDRLRVNGVAIGPDTTDPLLRKRSERALRALEILGRDPERGEATVSEDEIRALELQGKL
jgi:hypothetical protein